MDLRQLRTMVAVADLGSFSAAAGELGLTQPAVSGHVAALERELGVALFERAGRGGARLTEAGEAALEPARAALAAPEAVRGAVAQVTGLVVGRLALGHVASGAATTLAAPLADFHAAHPGVELSLVEDTSDHLVERVRAGRLDLAWVGLAGAPDERPTGLDGRTVTDEPVVVAVALGHPWAGRRRVALSAVLAEPLVALPPGTGARAALDAACVERRLEPRIGFECASPALLVELVRAGFGVGVVPAPLAAAWDLPHVELERPALRSRLDLVWRRGGPTSPAARAFLTHLR